MGTGGIRCTECSICGSIRCRGCDTVNAGAKTAKCTEAANGHRRVLN